MGSGRKVVAVLAACAASAACASSAAAFTDYPVGANDFTADGQSWGDVGHECGLDLLGLITLPIGAITPAACSVSNAYAQSTGKPPGSIATTYTAVAGLLGLIKGQGTWQSPSFTLSGTPTGAVFSLDRKADIGGLINLGGQATVTATLVDEKTGGSTVLLSQNLTSADDDFLLTPSSTTVPGSKLVADNRKYHLLIRTDMTTTLLQAALNASTVYYDNVRLRVSDGSDDHTDQIGIQTLSATNVTETSATLNGTVDPNAEATSYNFEYGDSTSYGGVTARKSAGNGNVPVQVSETLTGLQKCTTYHFQIRGANVLAAADTAAAVNNPKDSGGGDVTFTTNCQPSAKTLPAAPVAATTATLNGVVNPNGPATTYHYELGTAAGTYTTNTAERPAGSGTDPKSPLSEPLSGLTPTATYHYRIVATNALGTSAGEDMAFTLPPQSGPGPTGATGATGTPGTPGKNGTNGKNGADLTNLTLANGDARAYVIIRSRYARIGKKGARAGQVRLPIFCRQNTGRTCAGTVKIRTRHKINPASFGKPKPKRRVTFITFEYQLAAGKKGYAIGRSSREKLRLMRRLGKVAVDISVQVTGITGDRQTITQKGTFKAQNKLT